VQQELHVISPLEELTGRPLAQCTINKVGFLEWARVTLSAELAYCADNSPLF
jgi:hypothetical protein